MEILAASSTGSGMSSIIIIVLMIAFMYFFMIRPQQKQRKEHQSMVNHLKKGDQVVMAPVVFKAFAVGVVAQDVLELEA